MVVGLLVMVVLLLTDLLGAVGFSSFLVLWYYAVANLAALRLNATERRWPRFISVMGLVGCLGLGFSLSPSTVGLGVALLVVGGLGSRFRRQQS
jgi:APA family basic amino acid/polyamine antiporter